MTADEVLASVFDGETHGIALPADMTEKQKADAAAAISAVLEASGASGQNRVKILRDMGWTHGVSYSLNRICAIAAWQAIGQGDELWKVMPRRGRPKTITTEKEKV